jgi:hypothetical protein
MKTRPFRDARRTADWTRRPNTCVGASGRRRRRSSVFGALLGKNATHEQAVSSRATTRPAVQSSPLAPREDRPFAETVGAWRHFRLALHLAQRDGYFETATLILPADRFTLRKGTVPHYSFAGPCQHGRGARAFTGRCPTSRRRRPRGGVPARRSRPASGTPRLSSGRSAEDRPTRDRCRPATSRPY